MTAKAILPPGFDPSLYIALHPDLAAANVDGTEHYLNQPSAWLVPGMPPGMRAAISGGTTGGFVLRSGKPIECETP